MALALGCLPLAAATTDASDLGGLGLAAALSPWAWAALVLAVVACATELGAAGARTPVLTGVTGVLVMTTTGLPSVVEGAARVPTAWVHLGFVSAVARTGRIPAGVDARFSWAGFFAQWAWIVDAAGTSLPDQVLRWAPPVIVALWCVGVYAVARPLLGDGRAPWVAVWLFCGTNWIEQDYFSPQATAILLALAVLAVVLGPLATPGRPVGPPPHRPDRWPSEILLLWLVVGLCLLALVVDHQLTPFALGAQLLVLAVRRRFWGRWLLVLLLVAEVTWLVLGAREFWTSQLALATDDIGDVGGSLASSVTDRLVGDPGQLLIKAGRLAVAGATWALALIGAWVRWRRDRDLVVVVLAAVPVAIVGFQSYGGEAMLRVLLYGLPFLAVLGAEALRAAARRWRAATRRRPVPRRAGPVLLTAATAGLFAVLVLLRGGNDAYISVTPEDVALTRDVLAAAPPGSTVLPLVNQGPRQMGRVEDVGQSLARSGCETLAEDPARCTLAERPDAVVVLPSMDAEGVLLEGRPPGWSAAAIDQIAATGDYRVAYRDGLRAVLVEVPQ